MIKLVTVLLIGCFVVSEDIPEEQTEQFNET